MKMRKTKTKNWTILAFIIPMGIMVSCGQNTREEHGHSSEASNEVAEQRTAESGVPEFREEETAKAFAHYIHIKTALVNGEPEEAASGAKALLAVLEEQENQKKALEAANTIISKKELAAQREAFSILSQEMESRVKNDLTSGAVFKQYCPMAFDNTGAYWFSLEEEIRNPYFGDKMLKCGEVREVVGKP